MSRRTEAAAESSRVGGRRQLATFVLAAALVAAGGSLAFVAARGPETSRALPDRVRAVATTLRCPVCQNLSVADSPSGLAQQMRETIARDLAAGRSPDEIRARFVASYGDWVLLSPPRHGLELAVWILPGLLFLGGLVVAGLSVRRWSAGSPDAGRALEDPKDHALSPGDRKLLELALSALPEEDAG